MHFQYNENIPLHQNQPPPIFNINLPGRNQEKSLGNNAPIFIDPTLNFNSIQQNQPDQSFQNQSDNSCINHSFNAPFIQHNPLNYQQFPPHLNNSPQNPLNVLNNQQNIQMMNIPMQMNSPSLPVYNSNTNPLSGYGIGTTVNVVDALIPKSGYEKLMVPGIFVKQKMEWLEIFSGCETENKYKVYACDVAGNKEGHPLFKCREKSSCFQRQFLPGDCRKFNLDVAHDSEGKFSMDGDMFLEVIRPFKLTCLCFQRPFVEVNYKEDGKTEYIGRIIHNFDLCNMKMTLLDKANSERYVIKGSVFQIGLINQRGCPCKGCQQAFCFIYDNCGEIVGIIEKRGKGFKGMISDADNFSILFPIKSTLEERACILAATLFLDFRYFEDSENNRNNNYY